MIAEETSLWTQFAFSDVAGVLLGAAIGYFAHVWQASRHEIADAAKRYIAAVHAEGGIPAFKLTYQLNALKAADAHLFTTQKQFTRLFAYLDARGFDHPWRSDELMRALSPVDFFRFVNSTMANLNSPQDVLEVLKSFTLGDQAQIENHFS